MWSIFLPLVPVLLLAFAVLAATTLAARRSGEDLLSGPGEVVAQRAGRQAGRWARAIRRRASPPAPIDRPSRG